MSRGGAGRGEVVRDDVRGNVVVNAGAAIGAGRGCSDADGQGFQAAQEDAALPAQGGRRGCEAQVGEAAE